MARRSVFVGDEPPLEGAVQTVQQPPQRHVQMLRGWGDVQPGLVRYRLRKLRWTFEMAPRKLLMILLSLGMLGYSSGWFTPDPITGDSESPVEEERFAREAHQSGANFIRDFALVVLIGYSLLREFKSWNRQTNYKKLEAIFTNKKVARLVTNHQAELLHPRDEDMLQLADAFNNSFTGPMPFEKLHHPLIAFLNRFPYDPALVEYIHWRYKSVAQPPPPAAADACYRPAVPGDQARAEQVLNQAELVARVAEAFSLRHRADKRTAFMPQVTSPQEMHAHRNHGAELRRIEAELTGAVTSSSSDNGGEGTSAPGDADAPDVELQPLQHAAPDLAPPAAPQHFSFQETLNHLTLFLLGDIYRQLECAKGAVGLGDFVIFLGELLQDSDCFTVLNSEAQTPLAGRGLQLACLFTGVTVTGLFLERASYIAIGTDDPVSQFRVRAFKQLYPGIWRRIASTCCVSNASKIMPASLIFTLMSSHEIADLNPGRLVALSILRRSAEFSAQDQAKFFSLYVDTLYNTNHEIEMRNHLAWLFKQPEMGWSSLANHAPVLYARLLNVVTDNTRTPETPVEEDAEAAHLIEVNSLTQAQFFDLVWNGNIDPEKRTQILATLTDRALFLLLTRDDPESQQRILGLGFSLFKPLLESQNQGIREQAAKVFVKLLASDSEDGVGELLVRFFENCYPEYYMAFPETMAQLRAEYEDLGYGAFHVHFSLFNTHFSRVSALTAAIWSSEPDRTRARNMAVAVVKGYVAYLSEAAVAVELLRNNPALFFLQLAYQRLGVLCDPADDALTALDQKLVRVNEFQANVVDHPATVFLAIERGGNLRLDLPRLMHSCAVQRAATLDQLDGQNQLALFEQHEASELQDPAMRDDDRLPLGFFRAQQKALPGVELALQVFFQGGNRVTFLAGVMPFVQMLGREVVAGYPLAEYERHPARVNAALAFDALADYMHNYKYGVLPYDAYDPTAKAALRTTVLCFTALWQALYFYLYRLPAVGAGSEEFSVNAIHFHELVNAIPPLYSEPLDVKLPIYWVLEAMDDFIRINALPGQAEVRSRFVALYVHSAFRALNLLPGSGWCASSPRTYEAAEHLFELLKVFGVAPTTATFNDGAVAFADFNAGRFDQLLADIQAGSDGLGLALDRSLLNWFWDGAQAGILPQRVADEEEGTRRPRLPTDPTAAAVVARGGAIQDSDGFLRPTR